MTALLPNPFSGICGDTPYPSADMAPAAPGSASNAGAEQSQAKVTRGKAGRLEGIESFVRRSTAGTGLRVGEASADLPTTSEFMDVTAGETALNFESPVDDATPGDRSASASARSLADRLLDEIEAEFGGSPPSRFRLDEARFLEDIEEKPLFLRGGHA